MSYILDALKKAEAERRTGTQAGPHSPLPAASAWPHAERKTILRTPWPWIAMTAIAGLLAADAWLRPAPAVPRVALQAPAPAPMSAPVAAPAAPVESPKPPIAAIQPPAPLAQPAVEEEQPATPKPKAARPARPAAAEKKHAAAATPKTAEPPVSPPLPILRELPDNIQREIPQLSVGGYIYSGSKADRSVLINNRLMHEGEEIAPGLTLEKMMPNGMVLNYRGYRYRTGY